ncbi:MAG: triphosphoribosyl-dephospho-CoA synthase [Clostridia bacterium]|nr:triphosphoribosyl-dephospho-CoA synthase [Clostridia bacterium]
MKRLSDFTESAALYALSFEANVTPKPGLVDRNNTGAHKDMTLCMLIESAKAIAPFVGQCAQAGFDTKNASFESAFHALRALGLQAEKAMLSVTGGVNTHKGAIYCFCLLSGAFGRLQGEKGITPECILNTASLLAQKASDASLARALQAPVTHGDIAFQKARLSGARGEAIAGYPSILHIALPALERAMQDGFSENDAGVYALLSLISKVDDTCIYSRGGSEGLSFAKSLAAEALQADFVKKVYQIDALFIQQRLSPGGCADLLAAAMFIKRLIQSKWEEYTCE